MVLVVLDSSRDPRNQVNITILGNLDARNIPIVLVGNKTDLKSADISRIRNAFSKYNLVGVSAKTGDNINELYQTILKEL